MERGERATTKWNLCMDRTVFFSSNSLLHLSASCCNFCRYSWNFPPHTPIPKRREGRAGEHPLSDPFAIRSACTRLVPSEKYYRNPAHWEPRSQTQRLFQGHTFYCQSCGGAKPQTFSFLLSPPYKLGKKKSFSLQHLMDCTEIKGWWRNKNWTCPKPPLALAVKPNPCSRNLILDLQDLS